MINLLPWRKEKEQKGLWYYYLIFIVSVLTTVLALAFLQFYLKISLERYQERRNYLQREIALLTVNDPWIVNYKKWQHRFEEIQGASKKQQHLLGLLQKISASLPNEIYLTAITYDQNQWILQGQTPHAETVMQLAHQLNHQHLFSSIKVSDIKNETGKTQTFFTMEAHENFSR